jgi:hypothetical protein
MGHIAFSGTLQIGTGAVTDVNNTGVWSQGSGALDLVAREGSQAPGIPSGGLFDSFGFSSPVINDAGQTAFRADLRSGAGGVTINNNSGVWSEGTGALALVAREGDQAPGAPIGANFDDFFIGQHPVLNSAGQTAFVAGLEVGVAGVDANNNAGIWSEGNGALQLVTREGSQAPGTPDGVRFNFSARSPVSIVLNASGHIAFFSPLQFGGGGVTNLNDNGIWAEDFAGVLRLIVREGDLLEVTPGDFRTVSTLSFRGDSGNEDGRGSGFNDFGQVAFSATFTDGTSGVFVSNLATLPEPIALALGIVTVMLGAATMRRAGDVNSTNPPALLRSPRAGSRLAG